jgi:hypothetical protein
MAHAGFQGDGIEGVCMELYGHHLPVY